MYVISRMTEVRDFKYCIFFLSIMTYFKDSLLEAVR